MVFLNLYVFVYVILHFVLQNGTHYNYLGVFFYIFLLLSNFFARKCW